MGRKKTITEVDYLPENQESFHDVAYDQEEAWELVPWACALIEVEGGWMAFESADDLNRHLRQT